MIQHHVSCIKGKKRSACIYKAPSDSSRSRLGGVKVRHKRQVLQDMARPLKHWLYKHRDNPYPTKTEKVLLALGSHMTLVQVRDGTAWMLQGGQSESRHVLMSSLWGWRWSQYCPVTRCICVGFQLVRECPSEAEEHGETAWPKLGAEDQTVQ